MPWQDIVFTAGTWVFMIALVPSVISKDKPAVLTSLTTGIVLMVYAVAFASLSLKVSAVSSILISLTWLLLAWQKWQLNKKHKPEVSDGDNKK